MSAPFEVYAKSDGSHGDNSGFWHSEEYRDDDEVRYLRADLTCGECAKIEMGKSCAHKTAGEFIPSHFPACMAFAPKVTP